MKLNEYLNIENPTLEQLIETEALLHGAIDKASKELIALDAEDRGQALNRLRGQDEGAEARRVAREKAERDRSDAAEVLAGIQFKIAAEKALQDAEVEAVAWGVTWEHLARRRAAMHEIEKLCDKIAGLHGDDTILRSGHRERPQEARVARLDYSGTLCCGRVQGNRGEPQCADRLPAADG